MDRVNVLSRWINNNLCYRWNSEETMQGGEDDEHYEKRKLTTEFRLSSRNLWELTVLINLLTLIAPFFLYPRVCHWLYSFKMLRASFVSILMNFSYESAFSENSFVFIRFWQKHIQILTKRWNIFWGGNSVHLLGTNNMPMHHENIWTPMNLNT